MADQVSIVDGVMRVNGTGGHGIYPPHNMLWSQNFVFEFDILLKSAGDMGTFFRQRSSAVWYGLFVNSTDGTWLLHLSTGDRLAHGNQNVRPIGQMNRVILIVRRNRLAAYLNGQPVVYVEDATFSDAGNLMPSFHSVRSDEPAQGEFDNFRFWNLDGVPNLP